MSGCVNYTYNEILLLMVVAIHFTEILYRACKINKTHCLEGVCEVYLNLQFFRHLAHVLHHFATVKVVPFLLLVGVVVQTPDVNAVFDPLVIVVVVGFAGFPFLVVICRPVGVDPRSVGNILVKSEPHAVKRMPIGGIILLEVERIMQITCVLTGLKICGLV